MTLSIGVLPVVLGALGTKLAKTDGKLLQDLIQRCGGEIRKGALFATHGSIEFRVRVLPKHQGLIISVVCPLAGRFKVTRKGRLDRAMETFVPAETFRSRDARFDRDFNVQTRDHELATALLTNKSNREVIRGLVDRGVRAVHLDGERVKATCPRKTFGVNSVVADVLSIVEELAVLGDAVALFAAHHEVRPARAHDPLVVGSWIGLGLLGLAGLIMVIAGTTEFTPVLRAQFLVPCALIGLPLVLPVVFASSLAVSGRTSPYGLVRGLAALSLLVVPLFSSGVLLLVNGMLDDSPAVLHTPTVLRTRVKKNKNKLSYHVALESWWDEGDVRWVRVSLGTFDRIQPGVSRMQVQTRAGKLGYEWIEDYALKTE